jgi:hypothetical protein
VIMYSMGMMKYLYAQAIENLRLQAAQTESTYAAAQRFLEAHRAFLQKSVNAWAGFLMNSMVPYYRQRPEQRAARPSEESIEESEFLRAASTVIRDHAEALRELSTH